MGKAPRRPIWTASLAGFSLALVQPALATVTGIGDNFFLDSAGNTYVPGGPGIIGSRQNFASAIIGDINDGTVFITNHTLNFSQVIGIGQFTGVGWLQATGSTINARTLNMSSFAGTGVSFLDLTGTALTAQRAVIGVGNVSSLKVYSGSALSVLGTFVLGGQSSTVVDGSQIIVGASAPSSFPGMVGALNVEGYFSALNSSVLKLDKANGDIIRFFNGNKTAIFDSGSSLIARGDPAKPLQVTLNGDMLVKNSTVDVDTWVIGKAGFGSARVISQSSIKADSIVLGLGAGDIGSLQVQDSGDIATPLELGDMAIGSDGTGSVELQNSFGIAGDVQIATGSGIGSLKVINGTFGVHYLTVGGTLGSSATVSVFSDGFLSSDSAKILAGGDVVVTNGGTWAMPFLQIGEDGAFGKAGVTNFATMSGNIEVQELGEFINKIDGDFTGTITANKGGAAILQGDVHGDVTAANGGFISVQGNVFGLCTAGSGGLVNGGGDCANVDIKPGGTMSPGLSPGMFSAENDMIFEAGSILNMEIGGPGLGEYDRLAAGGLMRFDPGAQINFKFLVPLSIGQFDFDFFKAGSLSIDPGVVVKFSGLPSSFEIGSFQLGGKSSFIITSSSQGGVPEPATWTTMLAGFGAIGMAMRGRRNTAVSLA